MRTVSFSSGEKDLWRFGEDERARAEEAAALRAGILTPDDLARIDAAFPAPATKRRLQRL